MYVRGVFTLRNMRKCSVLLVHSVSVEQRTLHTLNERHIGDVVEATLQTSPLSKRQQGITAKGFLAPPAWRL